MSYHCNFRHTRVPGQEQRWTRSLLWFFPAALVLVAFEVPAGCCCGMVAKKRRLIFQPGKRGSDLLWRLGEMERRYESARGCRGSSGLNPLIVVCREVQQSSLGKLVCVLRKAATTLGIRLQEVRIHGHPPLNNKLSLTQSHLRRASEGALKLWINELSARGGFDGLRHRTPPPIVRDADP
jgi:hypothetical protein